MLSRLTDWFILEPTRHPLPADGKTRRTVRTRHGEVEVWTGRTHDLPPEIYVLKFIGSAGRAERATHHPADVQPGVPAEVWTLNPPGYGGSSGRARLSILAEVARCVCAELSQEADRRPIIAWGNSLGTALALHVGSQFPLHGLILRNPPPLREVIMGRFGWWSLGIGASLIARQIPAELDSCRNARRCRAPALFVTAAQDRIVPPRFQRQGMDAYAGKKRLVVLRDADHHSPPATSEHPRYRERVEWLLARARQVAASGQARPVGDAG